MMIKILNCNLQPQLFIEDFEVVQITAISTYSLFFYNIKVHNRIIKTVMFIVYNYDLVIESWLGM
jgi:hypothetical protein